MLDEKNTASKGEKKNKGGRETEMAGRTGRPIVEEDREIMLLFVNCTLSRHFVMSLLEVAAKKLAFLISRTPIEFTAWLNFQHVDHMARRWVSDGPATCGVNAPVTPPPLIVDAGYSTAKDDEACGSSSVVL